MSSVNKEIVVQAPPVFAPLVARWAGGRSVSVAIDVHSGAINTRRWSWSIPLLRAVMARSAMVLVTNDELLEGIGVDPSLVHVLHDPLVDRRAS